MSLDIDDLKSRFLNREFDTQTFTVSAEAIVDYARACGEVAARYTDPTHPDFQAPPTFPSSLQAGRRLPEGFPELPGLGMDAGKAVSPHRPIRPGTTLTGRSHLHDIYTKSGRSGRMVFFVIRMEIYDAAGSELASADTSVVIRERPTEGGAAHDRP
jgi:N-terminal half of MaoC dehydratase